MDKGVWRSPDGETWTKIIDGNFPGVYDRMALAINPNNEDEVYCFSQKLLPLVLVSLQMYFLEVVLGHHFGNIII